MGSTLNKVAVNGEGGGCFVNMGIRRMVVKIIGLTEVGQGDKC